MSDIKKIRDLLQIMYGILEFDIISADSNNRQNLDFQLRYKTNGNNVYLKAKDPGEFYKQLYDKFYKNLTEAIDSSVEKREKIIKHYLNNSNQAVVENNVKVSSAPNVRIDPLYHEPI